MGRHLNLSGYISEKGKTERAFAAYLDLLDAADAMKEKMTSQLYNFDLTLLEFRILVVLRRKGPLYQLQLSRLFRCSKQNVRRVLKRLVGVGLVRQEAAILPRRPSSPKSKKGRTVVLADLTREGVVKLGQIFPKHVKVVKAEMKALEGREQKLLSRLCRKLKEGDAVKFLQEIRMKDAEEELVWE